MDFLEPWWKGLFLVLLATNTALKVDGIVARVHISYVKCTDTPHPRDPCWMVQKEDNLLKLKVTQP